MPHVQAPPSGNDRISRGLVFADLRRDGIVSADDIRQAAAAYLADPACGPFRLQHGQTLDVAEAVKRHKSTAEALTNPKLPLKNCSLLVQDALSLSRTTPPPMFDPRVLWCSLDAGIEGCAMGG